MYEPKVTVKDIKIDTSVTMDACSDCGIPVMVDKDLKDGGRKSHCTSCLMRLKIKAAL
jgi:hypothetical protein